MIINHRGAEDPERKEERKNNIKYLLKEGVISWLPLVKGAGGIQR